MGRPKKSENKELSVIAESELSQIDDAALCIRLIAIMQAGERSVEDVAKDFKVSPRTIFRWMKNFKSSGIAGLKGGTKGHRLSKLGDEHKLHIRNWVQLGINSQGESISWTLEKLRSEIKAVFNIEISIMPLWLHLQKMGCGLKKNQSRMNSAAS